MAYEDEQSGQSSFNQPKAVNTVTIVDEPEENTIIYSWRNGQLKKLPYEERETKNGQRIKIFMTFVKSEMVMVVNVNKEALCLTVSAGILENNELRMPSKPVKYYASKKGAKRPGKYNHRVDADSPVLFFSLDPDDFGEEIKGTIVRE